MRTLANVLVQVQQVNQGVYYILSAFCESIVFKSLNCDRIVASHEGNKSMVNRK